MNTLKAFIFKNQEIQDVIKQTPNLSNNLFDNQTRCLENGDEFSVVENETVTSKDFNKLIISGSLFSLTTFINVSFDSCIFFATRIENCTFINCNFNNCTFEFSSCTFNKFEESVFNGNLITYTTFKDNNFYDSSLSQQFYNRLVNKNKLIKTKQIIPKTSQEETKTLIQSILFKKFVA